MELCNSFLKTAKQDLRASEILYANRLYPQAIFHLQQSIEKSFKSLGSLYDNFSMIDLRKKVGHYPLKILGQMMMKLNEVPEWQRLLNVKGFLKKQITKDNIDETSRMINIFNYSKNIDKTKFKKILYIMLKNMSEPLRKKNIKLVTPIMKIIIKSYIKTIPPKYQFEISKTTINKIIIDFNKVIPVFSEAIYLLIMLSFTIPPSSVQDSRYPTPEGLPDDIYKSTNYIVKVFPGLVKYCRTMQGMLTVLYQDIKILNIKYG